MDGVAAIELDGRIGRSAVLAQPNFELSHRERLDARREDDGGLTSADPDEMLAKEPGPENGMVVAPPSRGARASTCARVFAG